MWLVLVVDDSFSSFPPSYVACGRACHLPWLPSLHIMCTFCPILSFVKLWQGRDNNPNTYTVHSYGCHQRRRLINKSPVNGVGRSVGGWVNGWPCKSGCIVISKRRREEREMDMDHSPDSCTQMYINTKSIHSQPTHNTTDNIICDLIRLFSLPLLSVQPASQPASEQATKHSRKRIPKFQFEINLNCSWPHRSRFALSTKQMHSLLLCTIQ